MSTIKETVIRPLILINLLIMLAFIPQLSLASERSLTQTEQHALYCDRLYYWHRWRTSQWFGGQFFAGDWKMLKADKLYYFYPVKSVLT